MVVDSPDPKSAEEAAALAGAAHGIVTSDGRVAAALRKANVRRDVSDFAEKHVKVHAIGTSGVLELAVVDTNRNVAIVMANALADELVQVRQQLATAQMRELLTTLDAQIASSTKRIAELDAAASTSVNTADARAAQGDVLRLQHEEAIGQRSDLEAQRQRLLDQQGQPGPAGEQAAQRLAAVNGDIDTISKRINEIEAAVVAVANPNTSPADVLRVQHDDAVQQRAALETQRQGLLQAQAVRPAPMVLDQAALARPVATNFMADLILGGLLGLILGVAIAAAIEAIRPSVVGAEALARLLGVPLLGRLPRPPAQLDGLENHQLSNNVALAAAGAGVGIVHLVGTGAHADVGRLAEWIRDDTLGLLEVSSAPEVAVADGPAAPGWMRGATAPSHLPVHPDRSSVGVVLVAPSVLRRGDLSGLTHLLAMTHWTLIGTIAYRRPTWSLQRTPIAPVGAEVTGVPDEHHPRTAVRAS